MPNCVNGYIGDQEMGAFLRYRWCFFTIYGVALLKIIGYFIISFSQNVKGKSIPKSILAFQKWTKKMSKNEKG